MVPSVTDEHLSSLAFQSRSQENAPLSGFKCCLCGKFNKLILIFYLVN